MKITPEEATTDFLRPNKDATVSALSRFIKERNNVISVTDTSVKHSTLH